MSEEYLTWNEKTYQTLGDCVLKMCSGNPTKMQQGYISFFLLRNKFEGSEFDQYLDQLDTMRERAGFERVLSMVEKIKNNLIDTGTVPASEPKEPGFYEIKEDTIVLPPPEKCPGMRMTIKNKGNEPLKIVAPESVQVSLFDQLF